MRVRKAQPPEVRREQNLLTRYGMTAEDYRQMLARQKGVCALCDGIMERPVVDHCHSTGKVRGIICHPCNIKLPAVEDMGWVMLAWGYLEGDAVEQITAPQELEAA
jgi:hypothetical protein